jgi:hypothetical protein
MGQVDPSGREGNGKAIPSNTNQVNEQAEPELSSSTGAAPNQPFAAITTSINRA